MFDDLFYRLKALVGKKKLEAELDEELRLHLEHEAAKYEREGISADEAWRQANIALGGPEQVREACREARGIRWTEDLLQDCRYALRGVLRRKMFFALILVVLALGIGANTATFSIVDAVIIKPLPYRDPAKLLVVWDTYLPQFSKVGVSPAELAVWQEQKELFSETAWYRYVPLDGNLSVSGSEPTAIHADFASASLFPLLGISPIAGRLFSAAEDPSSALISEHLWRTHFASDPGIIGRTVYFNDHALTVIGVMSAANQFPDWAELWLPKGPLLGDQLTNPVRHALGFVARLQPGVSQEKASSRLIGLSRTLAAEHPKTSTGWGIRVRSLHDDLTENIRPALLLLLCAASFLLLIGCANIASLLLSRASSRLKEIAVRLAVGAGVCRIIRQLLTESVMLGLLGGLAGGAVAWVTLRFAVPTHARMEPAVFVFLLVISVATGILFGLAPAIQSARADTQSIIKAGASTSSGLATRSLLVIFEIALTLMLVIGAAILSKSFVRLLNTNPGFNPNGVLTIRLLAPPSKKPELLFHRMQENLLQMPGVLDVAITNALPLIADRANTSRFNVPGSPLINPDALPAAQIRTVNPTYFHAMQIPLRAGRVLDERDLNQSVVIINETMAKRFWPNRNPVGLKFINGPWGPNPSWATIVGVVADVKQFGLDSEPSFDLYYPSLVGQYLIIKTTGDPLTLKSTAEKTIRSIDPEVAVSDIRTMDEISSASSLTRRWTMGLLVSFAGLAFLLALIGIFGVISWSVAQRTREIGIRIALGAERSQVLLLFIRYGLKLTLAGLMCGVLASFTLRHTLATFVYGVSVADPFIYAAVCAGMICVSLLACYIPARKAANVDPMISLRYE
jgi:predicted permease